MRRAALLMGVAAALVGCAGSDEPLALDPLVDAVVRGGAPGALVLVREGGDTRTATAGASMLEPRRPLRADDRFRVGSVTKVFTAAITLQLVSEGRLGLESTVEDHLPGLLAGGDSITISELLSHRSGLYDHADLPDVASGDSTWEPEQLVRLAADRPRTAGFGYSSTNYVILGMLIGRLTGRTYAQVLRERITEPLGLADTSYEPGATIAGPHAHGHVPSVHDGFVRAATPAADRADADASWGGTAGAIVSTAPDLATSLAALLDGKVAPWRLLDHMLPEPLPGERSYGLGIGAFPLACGHGIGHTGNFLGTIAVAYRRGERTVIAMTNQHPLTNAGDTAFRRLVERAACD